MNNKNDDNQKQAIIRLIWGTIVLCSGIAGVIGVFASITALVILGAILDAVDSIVMADMGGIISAIFFGLAGAIVFFMAIQAPWWYGLAAGLCFESTLGGIIGYGWRLSNFLKKEKTVATKKAKKTLRNIIEKL